ncbi:alpha/beta fold hydrolase [Haloarculaceae archaeon H-GB2-1]|nr:alpha/beta fold hydrolase [Haloarculaceae archaeon H-GB1-1]MEA5387279.1 alpha/beta fold hydrolase [Haloarculaceae archaeon H-GB11]MEA5408745.1 alpha/beta fold hydrolase [Haloarculaceae archaeon H-GB2-1]
MKLRTALSAVAGGIGLTAAANRLLRSRATEFPAPLEDDQRTIRWRGFDVAYTEAGDPDDPDLVLLHGINAVASSHEFAEVLDGLAETYHVVAPDLPGFGHSDRPPIRYSSSLYVTFVADFLDRVADDPTVVASSLTGAYAAKAASEDAVSRLVLINPTTDTIPGRNAWLMSLVRSPLVGEALFNVVASKPSIRYFHADHGYDDTSKLTDEIVEYEWLSGHQPGARFAPASFVSGYLDVEFDLEPLLADLEVPVTLVWGRNADAPSLTDGQELAERADVRLVVVDRAALLPHVEHPKQFVDVVEEQISTV